MIRRGLAVCDLGWAMYGVKKTFAHAKFAFSPGKRRYAPSFCLCKNDFTELLCANGVCAGKFVNSENNLPLCWRNSRLRDAKREIIAEICDCSGKFTFCVRTFALMAFHLRLHRTRTGFTPFSLHIVFAARGDAGPPGHRIEAMFGRRVLRFFARTIS